MKISKNGIDLIKSFEGCVLHAYKPVDTEKYWTIGYGHYGSDVRENMTISQKEAEQLLVFDLRVFDYAVNSLVKVTLNQNQFDSLVSFAYNCGRENLRTSTLLKKVNQKDFKGAANEFDKWIHAGGKVLNGLIRRRKAEKELFLKPIKTTEKPKPKTKNYTIRSGENLTKIAQREDTTVKKIMELNPQIKNKNLVFAGQVIKVPN
jgi:GH24 family phage-related lysozyme (muramidase)